MSPAQRRLGPDADHFDEVAYNNARAIAIRDTMSTEEELAQTNQLDQLELAVLGGVAGITPEGRDWQEEADFERARCVTFARLYGRFG